MGNVFNNPVYSFSTENIPLTGKMKHSSAIEIFRMAHLLRKLLLTQLVECEKLPGQNNVVDEATTGQLHPYNDLTVRDHHGHRAEVDL